MRALFACCLVLVAVALFVAPARAQSRPTDAQMAEARAQFQAGVASFDAGAYEPALSAFERSYAITHTPELLFNIGLAAQRLGRRERAIEAYQGYVDALPNAADRADVQQRIDSLRALVVAAPIADPEPVSAVTPEPAQPEPEPARGENLVETWWFWTIVGVVVVGAGVGVGVGVASSGGVAPGIPGSDGTITTALEFR